MSSQLAGVWLGVETLQPVHHQGSPEPRLTLLHTQMESQRSFLGPRTHVASADWPKPSRLRRHQQRPEARKECRPSSRSLSRVARLADWLGVGHAAKQNTSADTF